MKTAPKSSFFTLKKNRKIKIFLFFLVLTSIIWVLIALSKNYTSVAVFKIEYENVPSNKLLQNKPVSNLEMLIEAPGFTLLRYKIKQHKLKFKLSNLGKTNQMYYLLPNAQIPYLNKQLKGDLKVLNVSIDTVFIEMGNNVSKMVPIHPNVDVKFKLGYNFIEKLKISPDSVLISGPKKIIDSILEINTNSIKLNDVYENIDLNLKLVRPLKRNIELSVTEVAAIGVVDKFTEGSFVLPVVVMNEPEGVKVNPFPKTIKVIYQVGLSNFNKISEDSFSVIYDYNQYKNDTLTRYLTPLVSLKTDLIYSVKIVPSQIEFLIQN